MTKRILNEKQAAKNAAAKAKRQAKAAANGLQVSGTNTAPAPAPLPTPPPLPVTAPTPAPVAAPAPMVSAPYKGETPPPHFTQAEIDLGRDPDGTWVATNIAESRIINAWKAANTVELVPTGKGKRYVSKTAPDSKYHLRDRSDVEKPVAVVHRLCAANLGAERKAVIALCLAEGVNKNTAATQYSVFHAKRKAAEAAAEQSEGAEE